MFRHLVIAFSTVTLLADGSDDAENNCSAKVLHTQCEDEQEDMSIMQTRRGGKRISKLQAKAPVSGSFARTAYVPAAVQARMDSSDSTHDAALVGCPHEEEGLLPLSNLLVGQGVEADVSLPSGVKYVLQASASVGTLTVPSGAELIFLDQPGLILTAHGIIVEGALRLGASGCPLQSQGIGVTLVGSSDGETYDADAAHSKGIIVLQGGVLEMYGRKYAPTWTRLASSADAGVTELVLEDSINWEIGQEIAIVTTSWLDDPDVHQNEERSIVDVSGKAITLDRPLTFAHYGGPEYAAEVALLSRSIIIQGDETSDSTRYGGHTMCVTGSQCRFSGVKGFRMGQENVMGRYPFHLHMLGDVDKNSFFEDCIVQRSYFRAFTIHGTSDSRISRNVAYDVSGSAYYLEDGVEEDNLFEFNLAALVQIIKRLDDYDNNCGQGGVTIESEPGRILPTDATAVGFYCTNAKNRWIGNSASGGFAGFHFPQVPKALGNSASLSPNYEPEAQELLEFDSNTAHSSGSQWCRGACMYVGGRLSESTPGSHDYSYTTGRYQPARKSGYFNFTNTKVFACRTGILFWGSKGREPELMLTGYEAHDIALSSSQLGNTYMVKAVISAHTNNVASDLPTVAEGFELYDTDMQTIMSHVTFRNFDRLGDACIIDMTHSNIFKPQGMFHTKALSFEAVPRSVRFHHVHRLACDTYHNDICKNSCDSCPGLSGSSQISTIVDTDGSGVGWELGAAILGADDSGAETNRGTNEWWHLDDSCAHEVDWGYFACPTLGHREVVSLYLVTGLYQTSYPSIIFTSRMDPAPVEGKLYHFGNKDRHIELGFAGSPQITGPCCDIGWYMHLSGGAQLGLTIYLDQMVPISGLILATSYPAGASLNVQRCMTDCTSMTRGSSLQDVYESPGTIFFVDSETRLFIKLQHEQNTYFEADGVKQLRVKNRYTGGKGIRYLISSDKTGDVPFSLPAPLPADYATISRVVPVIPCTKNYGNCADSQCCTGEGFKCFSKGDGYAQCRTKCSSSWETCELLTRPTLAPTVSPTQSPVETTAAPTPVVSPTPVPVEPAPSPTPVPTSEPELPDPTPAPSTPSPVPVPTSGPELPEPSPAPSNPNPACAPCISQWKLCLFSNGVCYDGYTESTCMAWSTNTWCASGASPPAPSPEPTPAPTSRPTSAPTPPPTPEPTAAPTLTPSPEPTPAPTPTPAPAPTPPPTHEPTPAPTLAPSLAPTPAPTPTHSPAPTPAPTLAPTSSDCVALHGKCGGKNYNGPTCCKAGSTCIVRNPWYSQCKPSS